MSYHHYSSVSSARRFNVFGDMLLILSFLIKKLNLSFGKGVVKMSANCNKSFPACRVKSVGSTALLENCCEIRKLDNILYHARGELAKSTALGAAATGTEETSNVGGLKYSSNIDVTRVIHGSSCPELNFSEAIAVSSSNVT
nr:hypothetical protein [Tanacetum cinerariifolium]